MGEDMLTSVQKEILQTLINLYQSSNGKSIKGEDIAEVMNRNPGTIRNQMQSLRSLGLVKGVPGPRGGYKPTIEAYHSLNITVSDKDSKVPVFCNEQILILKEMVKDWKIFLLLELNLPVFHSQANVKLPLKFWEVSKT